MNFHDPHLFGTFPSANQAILLPRPARLGSCMVSEARAYLATSVVPSGRDIQHDLSPSRACVIQITTPRMGQACAQSASLGAHALEECLCAGSSLVGVGVSATASHERGVAMVIGLTRSCYLSKRETGRDC